MSVSCACELLSVIVYARVRACVRLMSVYLCAPEVMSEMARRHVEAIETWSSGEHGR